MKRILILCSGNSCRSQMAMGYLRSFDHDIIVVSAGTKPVSEVNPYAIRVMKEEDINLSDEKPKNVGLFLAEEWDFVITVCGGANESCPVFTGKVDKRLHIGFEDPASATGTDEEIMAVFRTVRDEIKKKMQQFYLADIKGMQLPKCSCKS